MNKLNKKEVFEAIDMYECFENNKQQKFLIMKQEYKDNNVNNLPTKIRLSESYIKALFTLPSDKTNAKTRQKIVDTSDYFKTVNQFSACLSSNVVSPFNKFNCDKDKNDDDKLIYFCNETTNKLKDLINNSQTLQEEE